MNWNVFLILLTGVLLNAYAQLALKAATHRTGSISLSGAGLWSAVHTLSGSWIFWTALCAYGVSLVVWIIGLSRVPVSQAYPMLSLGYVVNALAAFWIFGEALPPLRIAGIGAIIVGVYLIARG